MVLNFIYIWKVCKQRAVQWLALCRICHICLKLDNFKSGLGIYFLCLFESILKASCSDRHKWIQNRSLYVNYYLTAYTLCRFKADSGPIL